MDFSIQELTKEGFPKLLQEIPQPPKNLNYRGNLPDSSLKLLAIVGSRRYTNYGKQVVDYLIQGLRGHNIGIISGLALGIDSLAHQAALDNDLYTLAIPGGGLNDEAIYPSQHKPLARKILEKGGGLLSEYEPNFRATRWSFPQRNRLVCGIAHATLIIEASEKSGSLITARMCIDYNRDLMVVPGNIFSDNSRGVHQFLKLGAAPITEPADILNALRLEIKSAVPPAKAAALSTEERLVIECLAEPLERDVLIRRLNLPTADVAVLLMRMEIGGLVVENGGVYTKVSQL